MNEIPNPKLLMCYHSAEHGGVEQQILDLIRGLSGDFDFYVACPDGPLVKDYMAAGAKAHINLYPKSEYDLEYVSKIKSIIKDKKIDILHAHELKTGALAMLGGVLAGCRKRVYHVHTPFCEWRYGGLKKYPALFINTIVNAIVGNLFATDVLALTPTIKSIRNKKEFIRQSKIRVIPNGIYLDQYLPNPRRSAEKRHAWDVPDTATVIGNLSRFSEEKGHEYLLHAFSTVYSQTPNAYLVLGGGGRLLPKMKKLAASLGVIDRVKFLGHFEEEDKRAILGAFSVFVFPTLTEGFGIAMIEAMAAELPVIASDIPVLHDVGGDSAHYVKPADATELAKAIELLISNPNYANELSVRTRKYVQNYTMQRFWDSYRDLYNTL